MSDLDQQFEELGDCVEQLISLLEEAGERFWIAYLRRGLKDVRAHKLAGATFILGCYGGESTFSDVVIAADLEQSDPLRYRNLNARLSELRTRTFESANAITSRRAW